jgi:hypothetical protein
MWCQEAKVDGLGGCLSCASARKSSASANFAPFSFRQTAPDAELFAVRQRVLKAIGAHDAAPANFLRFTGGRSALWKKQLRVNTHTVRLVLPATCCQFWVKE